MRKHSREPEQPGIRQHDSSGVFCTHVFFPKPSLTRLSEPPILRPFQGQQLTLHAQPAFRWRCLYLYIGSTRNVNVQPHNVLLTFQCQLPWNCNRIFHIFLSCFQCFPYWCLDPLWWDSLQIIKSARTSPASSSALALLQRLTGCYLNRRLHLHRYVT